MVTSVNIGNNSFSSFKGSGDQTGSSFELTSQAVLNNDPIAYLVFEAKFNCTLYGDFGQVLTLTDGKIRARIVRK